MLSIGDSKVSKLYLGDTECKKAYLSDAIVMDNSGPSGPSSVLNENSWQTISEVTSAGEAQNWWSVGDTKTIVLNGTVGTKIFNNLSVDAVIIGFDHNQTLESPGEHRIHWGIGAIDITPIALYDSNYGVKSTDGTKYFNLNHWGTSNYGGWAGCDARYDIFGSTNVSPSGYGANPVKGRSGYDANNYDIVNNPAKNTLMSAFPIDLRNVMKQVNKYTDNVAGKTGNVKGNVKKSIDYFFPFAEFEVRGSQKCANTYEKDYQLQYEFFKTIDNRKPFKYDSLSTRLYYSLRSPTNSTSGFYYAYFGESSPSSKSATESLGLYFGFAT